MKKNGFLLLALMGITVFCTMQFDSGCQQASKQKVVIDTSALNQLRTQSNRLTQLYQTQTIVLQKRNDSLQSLVFKQKSTLHQLRSKGENLKMTLQSAFNPLDSSTLTKATIQPLFNHYALLNMEEQRLCDSVIMNLDTLVGNKQKQLVLCGQAFSQLQNLSNEQQAQIKLLEQNLNTAYKTQKRKSLSNRLLASGLMIVSGVATTLLIVQARP